MYRLAEVRDLGKIMEIIDEIVVEMREGNIDQWDENYPREVDFLKDIDNKDLYVFEEGSEIKGFICVNEFESDSYKTVDWRMDERRIVIHRTAVNPRFRKEGMGTRLIEFAEELARERNISYIRTDTYSRNKKMIALFEKLGYIKVGEMEHRGKEEMFYCFDKIIDKI